MLIRAIIEAAAPRPRVPRAGGPLRLFHVETAGCEGCGMELAALSSPAFALARADIAFVGRPAEADALVITGALSHAMVPVVDAAWHALRGRRALMAVGACAIDGGPFGQNYALMGGLGRVAEASVTVPGCPAEPDAILDGLLALAADLR